jgi:hypothetical protein
MMLRVYIYIYIYIDMMVYIYREVHLYVIGSYIPLYDTYSLFCSLLGSVFSK